MTQLFKNPLLLIIVSAITISLVFGFVYLSYINPMMAEKERLEKKLSFEETMLNSIKGQAYKNTDNNVITLKSLYEKVPAKASIGQFLLSVEKAEVVSNSNVSNISISDVTMEEEEKNKLTLSFTVISPSYEAMQSFLRTIENNRRLTFIDSLSVNGNSGNFINSNQSVSYDVVISTYYLPKYKTMIEETVYNIQNNDAQ